MEFFGIIYLVGIVSGLLLLCLGYYALQVVPQLRRLYGSQRSSKVIFGIYSILNILAAFTWFAILVEALPLPTRIPLFDYGAVFAGLLLLVLVPLGLLSIYLIGRKSSRETTLAFRRYFLFSKILSIVSCVPGILVILFYLLLGISNR